MAGGHFNEQSRSFAVQLNLEIGTFVIDGKNIQSCYIIEDIFNICMTGKLTFIDHQGLLEYGPITGNERLQIIFGNQEEVGPFEKTMEFEIYKISRITSIPNAKTQAKPALEVYFIDPLFNKIGKLRFNKSWSESPLRASVIWQEILENMCGYSDFGEFLEMSDEEIKNFYMPWWTPLDAINWLIKRAKGSETGVPGYVMFQNSNNPGKNTLNWCTLEKLLMQGETDPNVYKFQDENLWYRNKILSWFKDGIDQTVKKVLPGGRSLGFDFLTKMRVGNGPEKICWGKPITFAEGINKYTCLGTKTLYPDISTPDVNFYPYFINLDGSNEEFQLNNQNFNNFIKRYINQQQISIIVRGFEGDGRRAGQMINIQWPSDLEEEFINKNLDGKFLVKSITHQFGAPPTPFLQKMVLIKNGYWKPEANLLNASKANP